MKRWEANIYMKCIAILAFGIIAAVFLMTIPADASDLSKKAVFTDFDDDVEEFTVCEVESPENGKIREMSGMPCENRKQFERWYANYEQTASEEMEVSELEESSSEVPVNETRCEVSEEETETVQEAVPHTAKVFAVNGETLNPELQALLYDALDRHGIGYFFEIACVQCYQESHFNVWAENPNGRDKGILQYRLQYWDWNRGDIFDPAAQFELYAEQMAARLNAGLSAEECISRHNTSDFVTAVNWEYVGQVKQHLANLREVE